MRYRNLGSTGVRLPAVGLGLMGMSDVYGRADKEECIATLHKALDVGITFWDTSDLYGNGANEELISPVLTQNRDKIFIASKFGFRKKGNGEGPARPGDTYIDTSPAYVKQALEASLRRLKIDTIDLYYAHRINPEIPVEDTVGAMAELVQEGKVRFLGLCEVGPDILRRANSVHPIAALQSEYSLLTRDVEAEILPTLRELGMSLVPYAPLIRGLITNTVDSGKLPPEDYRRNMARYKGEHYENNRALVAEFAQVAQEKGITPAQLALAWVLNQGEDIIPIPGTKRPKYLAENAAAADIILSKDEMERIEAIIKKYPNIGPRYH